LPPGWHLGQQVGGGGRHPLDRRSTAGDAIWPAVVTDATLRTY
jgi:hypothetical protein